MLQFKLKIGMTETISFKVAEDRWGFRSVAKTLVDGYKDITGVDIRQRAPTSAQPDGDPGPALRYGWACS